MASNAPLVNRTFKLNMDYTVDNFYRKADKGPRLQLKKGATGHITLVASDRKSVVVRVPKVDKRREFVLSVSRITVNSEQAFTRSVYRHSKVYIDYDVASPRGITLTGGRDWGELLNVINNGFVVRLKLNGSGTVVDLPFGDVRISSERHNTWDNTIHRRYQMCDDYDVKADDGSILFSLSKDMRGFVTDYNGDGMVRCRPQGQKESYTVPLPKVRLFTVVEKADFVNHTFKLRHPVVLSRGEEKLTLQTGRAAQGDQPAVARDIGIIEDVVFDTNGDPTGVRICVKTRDDLRVTIPPSSIIVGFEVGKYSIGWRPPQLTQAPLRGVSAPQTIGSDLRQHIKPVLQNIGANMALFPEMGGDYIAKINDPIGTAHSFLDGIFTASPQLPQVLARKSYTLEDLLDATSSAEQGNQRGGVYVRVYWDFPEDSEYFGNVYIYVGMTSVFEKRDADHVRASKAKKTKDEFHYKVLTAAKKRRVVQLSVHHSGGEDSKVHDECVRTVSEQLWTVILGSYADSVLNMDLDLTEEAYAAQAAISKWNFSGAAKILTMLARRSFQATGFSGGRIRSRFGVVHGLNKASPILSVSDETYHKTRYVSTDLTDRFVFRRAPANVTRRTAKGDMLTIVIMNGWYMHGAETTEFMITVPEDTARGLVAGSKVYTSWELMKRGPHPVPYFQLPNCGAFNNWQPTRNTGNSIGLCISWKDEKTDAWWQRYVQLYDPSLKKARQVAFVSTDEGAYKPYAEAMGILAFFRRARWTNPPAWYLDLGLAEIATVSIDHFTQKVELVPLRSPVTTWPAPQLDPNSAGTYMSNTLGLEHVGEKWQSFDVSKSTSEQDPVWKKFAKLQKLQAQGGKWNAIFKLTTNRKECDFDIVIKRVSPTLKSIEARGSS